ncbi:MAG: hypothetical protein COA50_02115 [Flavobacteriaceae bacterium]|nr:MAG: hypothetical protein COA50_02115 [Flavobacteriaceae bacterium]
MMRQKGGAKQITSFVFDTSKNKSLGTVKVTFDKAKKTISVEVPFGTNVTKLNPIIKISKGATINPKGAQDFTKPVTYTVTAANKAISKYVVTVLVDKNIGNKILKFSFEKSKNTALNNDIVGKIDGKKIQYL